MEATTVRVLVVDDFERFRRFVCSTLGKRRDLQVIGEASDGLEAVRKAEELKPNLIVLDIGLPTLNGIEVARQIRESCPHCKILFLSQESSADVAQEAFSLGAMGYVVKTYARRELSAAVEAVLEGRQFVSRGLSGHSFTDATDPQASRFRTQAGSPIAGTEKKEIARNHEVEFYSDEASFLAGLTRFVETTLEAGSKVIVVATESHRNGLLQGLQARGVDTVTAAQQERFLLLDAAEALSKFMENAGPSRERFLSTFAPLIRCAETNAEVKPKTVVVFGEMVAVLCTEGKTRAAIQLEQLWNELSLDHRFLLRCAYPTIALKGDLCAEICAEHSAVR